MTVADPPGSLRRRALASAALATYAANVTAAGLALLNVLITARALGPAGRGELAFLTTVAMLTATLATLGIEEAHGNLAGTEPGSRPALASNSAVLALLLGGLAAGLVLGLMAAFPAAAGGLGSGLRLVAAAAVPLLVLQIYLQFLIRADYGFAVTNAAALVAPVLTVCVNGGLTAAGRISVTTAFSIWVAAQAVSVALLAWYVTRRLAGFGRPRPSLARRAFGFGLKAHAGRVMKTGNYRLDQWILGSIAGSRELGLYSVAVAWSEAVFYVPEAIATVMRPRLVRSSRAEAAERGATAFRVAMLVAVPFVAVLLLAAPVLCTVVFGEQFRGAVDDLRVLAPGAFGMVALKLLANALTAQGKPMLANVALAVAFATTIALDVVLIPGRGGLGAAIASTAAYTAGGLAVAVVFARTLHGRLVDLVPRRGDLGRVFGAVRPG